MWEKHGTKKQGFRGIPPAQNCLFITVISANHPRPARRVYDTRRCFFDAGVFSRFLKKFPDSARTLRRTQTLTTVGLFLAIQMVLSSYGVIQLNDSLKISLAHLALAPTAMLFGPVAAALQGALSDILGFLLKPTGPYFPGFTISAALGGVIYGAFLFESDRKLWQIVLARAVIMVFVNIALNTFFLTMLYGPSQAAMLPVRALKNAMQFPIDCLLLTAVCRTVQRIPTPAGVR